MHNNKRVMHAIILVCHYGRPFSLVKKKMENWRFCNFLYVTVAVYFTYFESTDITIRRDGYVSNLKV